MKAGNADPLYGLDISEEAVLKARVNAEAAGITIHYINRDVRDFRHEYLFDEIVSDLPLTGRSRNLLELTELYSALNECRASEKGGAFSSIPPRKMLSAVL